MGGARSPHAETIMVLAPLPVHPHAAPNPPPPTPQGKHLHREGSIPEAMWPEQYQPESTRPRLI